MNWKQLMEGTEYTVLQEGIESPVRSITYDSRKAAAGSAFVCVSGGTFDGHQFAKNAAAQGTVLIVAERPLEEIPKEVTVLQVESTLAAMPVMACRFYAEPSETLNMVGVTGTKGKTTITTLIHRVLMAAGRKSGLIGTIENRIGDTVYPSGYTTPQAFDLQALLAQMKEEACSDAVMEVSSHSLALHRVDGIGFNYALFTNLSLDHLDFHKTMDAYLEAKMELFKRSERGLSNLDDPAGRKVLEAAYCPMMSYSLKDESADFYAHDPVMTIQGVTYQLRLPDGTEQKIFYPYPGRFNVYNTMAVFAITWMMGIPAETICEELGRRDRIVRGRFQVLLGPDQVSAIVDYSHAPDALENVLTTMEEFRTARIITVVGCGGDRDKSKRPVMGRIAGEHSDLVVATSDNPRTEDPMAILEAVESGIRETACPYVVIENRREAIREALRQAQSGDLVLVAGKGHEDYQIIGREKFHFDDVEEIQNAWADAGKER